MIIQFVEEYRTHSGMSAGHLVVVGFHDGHESSFLAELRDVHPSFAEDLVKAYNTREVIRKILAQQGPNGPLATALKDVLK